MSGYKNTVNVGPGKTYTLQFDNSLSMTAEISVTDLNAFLGASHFVVDIYVNSGLYQDYSSGNYNCFSVGTVNLGSCPQGGSGSIVIKCTNW